MVITRSSSWRAPESPGLCQKKWEAYATVLKRLTDSENSEVLMPGFEEELWYHFQRLPLRYSLVASSLEKVDDILTHKRLLLQARDLAPALEVFPVQDIDTAEEPSADCGSSLTMWKKIVIAFSTIDKPKLLADLSAMVSKANLNIWEALAFATDDGYALIVFVVDGWPNKDTEDLRYSLLKEAQKMEKGPWSPCSYQDSSFSDETFGFIIIDGRGCLLASLTGNSKNILHRFSADIPMKLTRGRACLDADTRLDKMREYVDKAAKLATEFFINPATSQPNIAGLILGGYDHFMTDLRQSDMFHQQLQSIILNVVNLTYGGKNGLSDAICSSFEVLSGVKLVHEKKLLQSYFAEIYHGTGKAVFGVDKTLRSLQMGAVDTLIVWQGLDVQRCVLKNCSSGQTIIKYLNQKQQDQTSLLGADADADFEVEEKTSLLGWLMDNHKHFGCSLEVVTEDSNQGSQFCRGLNGIGALLTHVPRTGFPPKSSSDSSDDSAEIVE